MQGHKGATSEQFSVQLGPILSAFPDQTFPIGAIHEFISSDTESAAASARFTESITGQLMRGSGTAFWIGLRRTIFPTALKIFGIKPQRLIFLELSKPKECLWAIEEALKCKSVAAVIGDVGDLNFADSRRLQLAVENSRVTGFIHRFRPRAEHPVACVTRWKISPLPSETNGLPGVGGPRWHIELNKVRNGQPGAWDIEWLDKAFHEIGKSAQVIPEYYHYNTA